MQLDEDKELLAAQLKGSLLQFTKFFFQHITGREFVVSNPVGRESHHITICRELTKVFYLKSESQCLNINIQPGSHKSTLLSMFVAWSWAHYPDCNFLYISYSHELGAKQTAFIKQIVQSKIYGYLFDVHLKQDSRAKDHFETMAGGAVKAFGSAGGITGQNAGLPSQNRFSGAVLLDDCLKPKDAHSDTIRSGVIENYRETIVPRPRGINVPILSIAQRVHEDDLCAFFTSGRDVKKWGSVILKSLDEAGNVLHPEVTTKEYLLALQDKSPYLFSSQYQQNPIPAGGALFKPSGFVLLDEEPEILCTFITADTAETTKSYNDATVFSFWGLYEIETMGRKTGQMGLHWLDCQELRIEPKDLEQAFLDFWQECMRHKIPPKIAAIEKKSTGVTLVSVLSEIRAITIRAVERSSASGSKSNRFIQLQPIIASKLISFTNNGRHVKMCIEHMSKITANDTHRNDDICDTVYDACKIALIDKTIYSIEKEDTSRADKFKSLSQSFNKRIAAGAARNV
jgi:predicted phage terminase large subunit-like protein